MYEEDTHVSLLHYIILAGAPASGGLTCYGTSYTRQAVEHQLHMHGIPNCMSLQLRKNVICLNWSLDYLPNVVMPFKCSLFVCVYSGIPFCSNTRVKTGSAMRL